MPEQTVAYALIPAEDAQSLPMPLHRLDRDQPDEDGIPARPVAVCTAPEGAACRLVCAEDCGAEWWPCGGYGYDYDADEEREPHPMRDGRYCNVVEYLNEENADDLLDEGWAGDAEACGYAGPISVRWSDGDKTYLWQPAPSAKTEYGATS